MRPQRLHTIGEASDLIGVTIQMLRVYEREGLILPVRRSSRHRRYSEQDIERIRCIRAIINDDSISIAALRHILALIPCWRIKHCPEESRARCAAFAEHSSPCWIITNKSWQCKSSECRQCEVYVKNADCSVLKRAIAAFKVSQVPG